MISPFEFMVAGRYLRARKAEGFVSVIAGFSFVGIMLGVTTLIIVMAVMNGFRQELITRMLGLNGHVNVFYNGQPMDDYKTMALKVSDIEGISAVFPVIEGQALISSGSSATGTLVRGLSQVDLQRKPVLSGGFIAGDPMDFDGNVVAIGIKMAEKMGLGIGDEMTLIAPKGKASPFGTIPRSRSYEIALIFDVGMYEYNANFVFMPLKAAQAFYQMQDSVAALELFTHNPAEIDKVVSRLQAALPNYTRIVDWRSMNSTFFNALQVERNVMFLILTMIILVAAFNIISSMIMLVKDKSPDIAIMRTMGATRGNMLRIFMLTGATIGFLGTIFGAVFGILFATNIESIRRFLEGLTGTELFADEVYFLSQLPAEIDWLEVTAVMGMAFALTILATIIPAMRAARLDPVEALRYE